MVAAMKMCRKCLGRKPLDAFSKDARNKTDGRQPKCKQCVRKHRQTNAEQQREYRQANAERIAEYKREHYEANPDCYYRASAKRRAAQRNAVHEPYSRTEIFARWGSACCYCDSPAEHLDHVQPISRGGADAAWNLVPACKSCNLSKGAKTLAEWA